MTANPQSFFRFAARYYPLLIDLFYRFEGVELAPAELSYIAQAIWKNFSANTPSPDC